MKRVIRLCAGFILAMLTDISWGLFIAHILRKEMNYSFPLTIGGINLSLIVIYGGGIFFTLFPDLDIPIRKILKGTVTGHRSVPHYPLLVIGGWFIAFFFLSLQWPFLLWWAILAPLCSLAHLLHDSIGGGIPWLWPLKKDYYQFFAVQDGKRKFVSVWNQHYLELEEYLEEYFEGFLRLTPQALLPLLWFVGVVITLILE